MPGSGQGLTRLALGVEKGTPGATSVTEGSEVGERRAAGYGWL